MIQALRADEPLRLALLKGIGLDGLNALFTEANGELAALFAETDLQPFAKVPLNSWGWLFPRTCFALKRPG